MNGTEMKDELTLKKYCQPKKNINSKKTENFRFEMKNVIVLRPFGSSTYLFVEYENVNNI